MATGHAEWRPWRPSGPHFEMAAGGKGSCQPSSGCISIILFKKHLEHAVYIILIYTYIYIYIYLFIPNYIIYIYPKIIETTHSLKETSTKSPHLQLGEESLVVVLWSKDTGELVLLGQAPSQTGTMEIDDSESHTQVQMGWHMYIYIDR